MPAGLALELLVEAQPLAAGGALEDHFAGFAIADLDGIHQPLVQVRPDRDAVHQHEQRLREIDIQQRFRRRELEELRPSWNSRLKPFLRSSKRWSRSACRAVRWSPSRETARTSASPPAAPAGAPPLHPPCPCAPASRTAGRRSGPRARTAGAENRSTRWRWRPSSADSGWCSSGGSPPPARCRRSRPPPAFPCAPETAARRRRATPRSAAVPPRRSCRTPATICRSPRRR